MYLEIEELGDKVGEVHVNPYSYSYDGDRSYIQNQLEEWEEEGEITGVVDYIHTTQDTDVPPQAAERRATSTEEKLEKAKIELKDIGVYLTIVE